MAPRTVKLMSRTAYDTAEVKGGLGEMGPSKFGSIDCTFTGYAKGSLQLYVTNLNDGTKGKASGSAVTIARGIGALFDLGGVGYKYATVGWTPELVTGKAWAYTAVVTGAAFARSGAGPYVVTVTSNAHGLLTGATIGVGNGSDADVNGVRTITKIDDNSFSFPLVADPGANGTLDYTPGGYTITVTSAAHGYLSNDKLNMYGGSITMVNSADATITKTGADTFTYQVQTLPSAASGTVSHGPGTSVLIDMDFYAKD